MIADAQRVVVTSQSQQILSAPAATGDLLCMFTWNYLAKEEAVSVARFSHSLSVLHVFFFLTEYRNLARGLPIVNQQVSLDCSYCQQRTGL